MTNYISRKRGSSFITNEQDQYAQFSEKINSLNQNEPLINQKFLKDHISEKKGFIKNRVQKKDYKCLAMIINTHLNCFKLLLNQSGKLQQDLTKIIKKNQINNQKVQVLQKDKNELQQRSERLKSRVLNGYIQNQNQPKPIKRQPQQANKNIKKNIWSNLQQHKPQPANPKYYATNHNYSVVQVKQNQQEESSQIYSKVRLEDQPSIQRRTSSQPQKGGQYFKIQRRQQATKVTAKGKNNTSFNCPQKQKAELNLYKLPNKINSRLQTNMMKLPQKIQSKMVDAQMLDLPKNMQSKYVKQSNNTLNPRQDFFDEELSVQLVSKGQKNQRKDYFKMKK